MLVEADNRTLEQTENNQNMEGLQMVSGKQKRMYF